jgi:hypothetical protein
MNLCFGSRSIKSAGGKTVSKTHLHINIRQGRKMYHKMKKAYYLSRFKIMMKNEKGLLVL